jgi:hypothetical protein
MDISELYNILNEDIQELLDNLAEMDEKLDKIIKEMK